MLGCHAANQGWPKAFIIPPTNRRVCVPAPWILAGLWLPFRHSVEALLCLCRSTQNVTLHRTALTCQLRPSLVNLLP